MTWQEAREQMIQQQLVRRGINDPRIVHAFRTVPRHRFMPANQQPRAYEDRALGIGLDQTISQPYMVGTMLKALALQGKEKVLEIGTGWGYEAALLGMLAREVHTVELLPELADQAHQAMADLGIQNVSVYQRDGSGGLPEEAPFDAIIVAAAAPAIPPPLCDQLATHGRLLLPVEEKDHAVLTLVRRADMGFEMVRLGNCAFVPLRGSYGR